jgi:hypothetical protein
MGNHRTATFALSLKTQNTAFNNNHTTFNTYLDYHLETTMASPALSTEPIITQLLSSITHTEKQRQTRLAALANMGTLYATVGISPHNPSSTAMAAVCAAQPAELATLQQQILVVIIEAGFALSKPKCDRCEQDEVFLWDCKKQWVRLKREVKRCDIKGEYAMWGTQKTLDQGMRRMGVLSMCGAGAARTSEERYGAHWDMFVAEMEG